MSQLIAYYSRAGENFFGDGIRTGSVGNTEKAARRIEEITGAVSFRIEQEEPYAQEYAACTRQAAKDWKEGARPPLARTLPSLDGYDEIFLGYPIYCGTMPMAVYTFLEAYDWTGKVIRPFCTHEGTGLAGTVNDIARAAKGARVTEGLDIRGSRVDEETAAIDAWCAKWHRA